MKKKLLIVAIAGFFAACGNGSESSTSADSTINSTTPPPTLDSTSEIGPMMSDTSTAVAEVVDLSMKENKPVVEKVFAAVDCGIVVNPDAAANMGEGAIIDGIGNALYGEMTFKDGVPQKNNFHTYRMIRHSEAPKSIEVHFVKNDKDPTGLGEPLFPPIFAAVANALHKATGKRFYDQPFAKQLETNSPIT